MFQRCETDAGSGKFQSMEFLLPGRSPLGYGFTEAGPSPDNHPSAPGRRCFPIFVSAYQDIDMIAFKESSQKSLISPQDIQDRIAIAAILLVAAILYFYQLGAESLWPDEFLSVNAAQAVPGTISAVRPVYFVLLRLWMVFGESDVWLRMFSIPFALGTVFLTYRLGCHLLSRSTGLIAASLLALSPLFINHTQEIRMYTLSTFLGVLGTLVFVFALERRSGQLLAGWLALRVAAILTTPLNVLLLLPDCLVLGWQLRRQKRLLLIVGGVLLLLAVVSLPWAIQFINASLDFFGGWVANADKPDLQSILSRLTIATAFWPLQSIDSAAMMHFYKLYTVMLAGVLGACLCSRQPKSKFVYLTALLVLPTGALLVVSWLFAPVWLPRYLLFVMPYLLILLAEGFRTIRNWQPKLAVVIAVMYAFAVTGGLNEYYGKQYRDDWRGVAQWIDQNDQAGDAIAIHSNTRALPLFVGRYYSGDAPISILDSREEQPQMPEGYSRLWLVHKDTGSDGERDLELKRLLEQDFEIQEHQEFKTDTGWEELIEGFLLVPRSS